MASSTSTTEPPPDRDTTIGTLHAKAQVRELLGAFGWPASAIIDLGDITTARGTEGHVLLWLRLWGLVASGDFNIKLVR